MRAVVFHAFASLRSMWDAKFRRVKEQDCSRVSPSIDASCMKPLDTSHSLEIDIIQRPTSCESGAVVDAAFSYSTSAMVRKPDSARIGEGNRCEVVCRI